MKTRKVVASLLVLGMMFTSCEQPEESNAVKANQKHPVNLSFSSYSVAKASPFDFLMPSAYAAVSELKFCFKRLRFKRDLPDGQPDTTEDNVDLELGEVVISNSGTALGQISVPADTYKRIEFDVEPDCMGTTANSISLSNDYGAYSASETITVKFEGTFIVDGEENLELGVQNILDAANAYDGVGSLKDAMEAVSGNI